MERATLFYMPAIAVSYTFLKYYMISAYTIYQGKEVTNGRNFISL